MCNITLKVEGKPEELAEMLNINEYKRAINDIKISLEEMENFEVKEFLREEWRDIIGELNIYD